MRKTVTLFLFLLPLFARSQNITERGDQIAFQEMRGDTVVIKGSQPMIINSDESHCYKWVFKKDGIKVGEYTAPEEVPYLLAIINPGTYEVTRYTVYLGLFRIPEFSKSNTIIVNHRIIQEYSE